MYDDPSVLPHLFGRWAVPNDIDMFIHESKVDVLHTALVKGFDVMKCFSRDPTQYIPDIDVNGDEVDHQRWRLRPIRPSMAAQMRDTLRDNVSFAMYTHLAKLMVPFLFQMALVDAPPIMMDIFVSKVPLDSPLPQPRPPFGKVDFMCNGLELTGAGIQLSRGIVAPLIREPIRKHRMLNRILEQILRKEAVINDASTPLFRFTKMRAKGWAVKGAEYRVVVPMPLAANPEQCIICHDAFNDAAPEADGHDHYKLTCCNARYHSACLVRAAEAGQTAMIDTRECIHCKKYQLDITPDIDLLKKMAPPPI
jgi:hypothetical protein